MHKALREALRTEALYEALHKALREALHTEALYKALHKALYKALRTEALHKALREALRTEALHKALYRVPAIFPIASTHISTYVAALFFLPFLPSLHPPYLGRH